MAVAKKEKKEAGCPAWLATYGDMVTNLLVFFVLMLSMSEVKKEQQFIDVMQAIREAFGYVGGIQQTPLEEVMQTKNVNIAEMLIVPVRPHDFSHAPDPGIRGKHRAVRNIRYEEHYAVGGPCYFDALSAELPPERSSVIDGYVERLRGLRTQIEVRGHCSRLPVDGSEYEDHFSLSLARARTVARALIKSGVDPDRVVVVGAGANEPVAVDAYTPAERAKNDRVEVLQVNRRVEDFDNNDPAPSDAQSSTGEANVSSDS